LGTWHYIPAQTAENKGQDLKRGRLNKYEQVDPLEQAIEN
jgi:hypothetical protein